MHVSGLPPPKNVLLIAAVPSPNVQDFCWCHFYLVDFSFFLLLLLFLLIAEHKVRLTLFLLPLCIKWISDKFMLCWTLRRKRGALTSHLQLDAVNCVKMFSPVTAIMCDTPSVGINKISSSFAASCLRKSPTCSSIPLQRFRLALII